MTKLMKKEKNTKAITQFYPDYDYSEKTKEEEENIKEEDRVASPKIKSNSNKVCSKFLNSSTGYSFLRSIAFFFTQIYITI